MKKIIDLHPEDLLDKEANGELTDNERAMLDAHLSRCETCRFEREVRADFADELGDDEIDLSSQRLALLIEGTHVAAPKKADVADEPAKAPVRGDSRESKPGPEPLPLDDAREDEEALKVAGIASRRGSGRSRRTMRMVMLVAAALLVGSAATAGAGARVWARLAAVWSEPAPAAEEPNASSPSPTSPSRAARPAHLSTPPSAPSDTTPTPDVDAVMPTDVAPPQAVVPVNAPIPSPVVAPPAPAPSLDTAPALFDAANEARRQGDYARAITISRRLQHMHPSSREAHTSHATVGRLLLDRGDAAGALASFDAYQARGSGALDESVMVGRATALERLGRTEEAKSAWRALLTSFPETPYAEHARTRVQSSRPNMP